jgi:hypothetical protein
MESHRETFAHPNGELLGRESGFGALNLLQIRAHLGGEFVSALGSTLVWQEAVQAVLSKLPLGLIDRGPGKAELRGGTRDRIALLLKSAQRFVLELEQIVGVEELRSAEEGMAHPSGAGIEGAGLAEGGVLGTGIGGGRHAL